MELDCEFQLENTNKVQRGMLGMGQVRGPVKMTVTVQMSIRTSECK